MTHKSVAVQIIEAIKDEDGELLKRLFKENPEQIKFYTPFGGQTWLGYASQIGKLKSVKLLVEIGIDVNIGGKIDNIKPVCSAAARGHLEVVEYLISCGADLDVDLSVKNPLFAAIIGRSTEVVNLLLVSGIDSTVSYNSKTMRDMDAVAFALMNGEVECARIIALWNFKGDVEVAEAYLKEADQIAEINARGVSTKRKKKKCQNSN